MILDGVRNLCWADAGFKAASPGGINPIKVPEDATFPMTTYQRVGGTSAQDLEGVGAQKIRVQFNFHALDADGAEAAHAALRAVLEGYQGALSDGTFLQNAEYLQPIDFLDYEPRRFRTACEFYLYFNLPNA